MLEKWVRALSPSVRNSGSSCWELGEVGAGQSPQGSLQKEGSKASAFSVKGVREAKGKQMRNVGCGVGQT